jgi:hypothetical protein
MMVLTVRVGSCLTNAGTDPAYPNELPGYEFHERAKWGALQPLVSRQADAIALLGEQNGFVDAGDGWKFGVLYWGESGSCNGHPFPAQLVGTVSQILLIPSARVSFVGVRFPAAFTKSLEHSSHAADGTWNV